MKKYIKGFTLIELLVVIAIIGILASVVLVSLNSARGKGKDTHIIADVQQIRTQLESDSNGSNYNNDFTGLGVAPVLAGNSGVTTYSTYNQIFADVNSNTPSGTSATTTAVAAGTVGSLPRSLVVVVDNNTTVKAYSIHGYLSTGYYFCIDSTGRTDATEAAAAITPASVTCQ